MKHYIHLLCVVGTVALSTLFCPTAARGNIITAALSPADAGTIIIENDRMTPTGGFLTDQVRVNKNFTTLDPIDIILTVDSDQEIRIDEGAGLDLIQEFTINNHTMFSWTDFHFVVLQGIAGDEDLFTALIGRVPASSMSTSTTWDLTFAEQNAVKPGEFLRVGLIFSVHAGQVVVRQTPSVPEPNSLALLGPAFLILLYRCCRRTMGARNGARCRAWHFRAAFQ